MEVDANVVMDMYADQLKQANHTIILLQAQAKKLKEEIERLKDGEDNDNGHVKSNH